MKVLCRVSHDEGSQGTLVEAATTAEKAAFMPADPTKLFCITTEGLILLNLRACPECVGFCQAVDAHYSVPSAMSSMLCQLISHANLPVFSII